MNKLLPLAALSLLFGGCADQAKIDDLTARLEANETKIAELEKRAAAKPAAPPAAAKPPPRPTEADVVGKAAGKIEVDKWFQGEVADMDEGTTLLVFWELWCPHCKREVPNLTARYDKYKGKGLKMVGLTRQSRNVPDADVEGFLKEKGVNYPIAKESGKMAGHFGVSGIPAAAVVKDGKIVWRGHPARLNDEMLEDWLN